MRASPVQIAKILEAATTPQGVTRTIGDIAFHKLLADSSGNQLAASLYAFLRRVGSDHRLHVPMASAITSERIQQRDQEHRAIAEAIAARVRRTPPNRRCASTCGGCSARSPIA